MAEMDPAAEPEQTASAKRAELGERLDGLARRALDECRLSLMMSFRFFDAALWQMPYEAAELKKPTGSDGVRLLYDPALVVRTYRESPEELIRDYLHTILHCVFRQPFSTVRADAELWSRACDLCVESIALEMCKERFSCAFDGMRREALAHIAGDIGVITPAKAYRRMLEAIDDPRELKDAGLPPEMLFDEEGLFARDDHSMWRLSGAAVLQEGAGDGEPGDGDSDETDGEQAGSSEGGEQQDGDGRPEGRDAGGDQDDGTGASGSSGGEDDGSDSGESPSASSGAGDGEGDESDGASQSAPPGDVGEDGPQGGGSGGDAPDDGERGASYEEGELPEEEIERAQAAWERIAREVETDLETMSKQRGDGMGTLTSNLELANRSQVDYADFLRRFSTMAEDMVLNDEEFDYIFYTYGLKRYGNMPLIEPLEYKETDRVREFVVVLDTSGSCSGELVRTFVTRTYEILRESGEFDQKVNVHIIQCDAEVQSDDKIENVEELKRFEQGFEVRGLGGTDFRPAFAYVDELLEQGEFEDLRGLIYFTDGWGVFPKKRPEYETAFVFVEEEGKTRRVPPWAMRVVLTQEDIEELGPGAV